MIDHLLSNGQKVKTMSWLNKKNQVQNECEWNSDKMRIQSIVN
jgi:hypothetical protein